MQEAKKLRNQNGKVLLEESRENEIGIFTSVPLLQGNLLKDSSIKIWMRDLAVNTPAQAAIQFVRRVGIPLIAPLIGHKSPKHVEENLELTRIPIVP